MSVRVMGHDTVTSLDHTQARTENVRLRPALADYYVGLLKSLS